MLRLADLEREAESLRQRLEQCQHNMLTRLYNKRIAAITHHRSAYQCACLVSLLKLIKHREKSVLHDAMYRNCTSSLLYTRHI